MKYTLTGGQTVGPYFHVGFDGKNLTDLVHASAGTASGEAIAVAGLVRDGDGAPIPDAVLEIWQANAKGRYAHPEDLQNTPLDPHFKGFGRVPTDAKGQFAFRTIKPGAVPGLDAAKQAPHLNITLFMRGQLMHLHTRLYFADEPANASDPVLNLIEPARRKTLLAEPTGTGAYRWDIVMQGDNETVFFDV
jgi:protocatechuate 3,4-dioxygenase alpha subunit